MPLKRTPSRKPSAPPSRPAPARPAAPPPPQFEKQPGLITSAENDKVRFLKNLQSKKDRYMAKHFLVEGVRLVEEALRAPTLPFITLYDPEALLKTDAGTRLLQRLIELSQDKKSVFPTTPKLIEMVSDTVTPQGVAAAVRFINWDDAKFTSAKLHIVLDGLQDPGNLGTILRSAGAAGDTAIWLTENSVDFYSPKVVRAGMGAHFRVPAKFDQKWDMLKTQFKAAGVEEIYVADGGSEGESSSTTRPRKADNLPEALYSNIDFKKPCAVIIGNEARGATSSAWQSATHRLNIPMPGGAESLNAGVAASLIIFEALRQRSAE